MTIASPAVPKVTTPETPTTRAFRVPFPRFYSDFTHLRDEGLQQRPQPLHRAPLAQLLDSAVPIEIDHAERHAGQPPPHRAHPLAEVLAQEQLVLPLRLAAKHGSALQHLGLFPHLDQRAESLHARKNSSYQQEAQLMGTEHN